MMQLNRNNENLHLILHRGLCSFSVVEAWKVLSPWGCWCSVTSWGRGCRRPGHVHRLGMHDGVLQPCGQTGCATCSGGSAEVELVKCFAVDLRDSTFLLKFTESSLVQLVVLYETNYFPQSRLHSIHFILLRRMMCSIDPAVKSRSHFGLPSLCKLRGIVTMTTNLIYK